MAITAAQHLSKIMNAKIAGHVGTGRQQTLVMVNTSMFRHPKYYKELRKRNKSDQVISRGDSTEAGRRAPDQGQSTKPQAPSVKPQASSTKSIKHQATSSKLFGSEPQAQGSSSKPRVTSSSILEPRYKNHGKCFEDLCLWSSIRM